MKRNLLLIGLLLLSGAVTATTLGHDDTMSGNVAKIKIVKQGTPPETKPRPKSVTLDTVECWLDAEAETIEILFNEPIGNVTVTITDAVGNTLFQALCDSSVGTVLIPSPSQPGAYTIHFVSTSYCGYGYFYL